MMIWPSVSSFVIATGFLGGVSAVIMAQGVVSTWKPLFHVWLYAVIIALFDRFLIYALFEGELLSVVGFLVEFVLVGMVASVSWYHHKALKMCAQYPWKYERIGAFRYRKKELA